MVVVVRVVDDVVAAARYWLLMIERPVQPSYNYKAESFVDQLMELMDYYLILTS